MHYIPLDDLDLIAEELSPSFCGRTLSEIRKDVRECTPKCKEFDIAAKQLYELFALAQAERFRRMGLEVKAGNAKALEREPGCDDQ